MSWLQWNPPFGWPGRMAVAIAVVAFLFLLYRIVRRRRDAWPPERNDNGIRVGAPKVYDNRSLSLMLEQLEAQLRTMQGIDGSAVRGSIGTQQGEVRSDLSGALSATLDIAAKSATESKGKSGEAAPGKGDSAAAKDGLSLPDAQTPLKWGERAVDLLNDQVGLSYEIFNLRLLLERALSDRLQGEFTRLQAVIGVPISLDPPPYATDCAATVELKIGRNASLVALFPQEETFNTWGVDRRRFQLGGNAQAGGGVTGSVSLGKGKQSSFLRRQAEVVAMERESESNELIVAWQFRPAPGGRTVTAGLRQMLMVIALPDADTPGDPVTIEAQVRSSWQKWRSSTETAKRGAGWRALFSNRPTHHNWGKHGAFEVPKTHEVERKLQPGIDSISFARIGGKEAAIIVKGTNFFTGTTVALGDTVLDSEHGVTIKSELSMQLIAPIESLVHDGVLNGRYGPSMRLVSPVPPHLVPLKITDVGITPSPSGDSYMVELTITTRDGEPLNWAAFSKMPDPIFGINGRVVPDLLSFSYPKPHIRASVRVAAEFLPNRSALLLLRWPFYGEEWSLDYQTYDPELRVTAVRSASAGRVSLLFSGATFVDEVKLVLDGPYSITHDGPLTRLADDLLKLELAAEKVNAHRECFLCEPHAASLRIPLPAPTAIVEPSLDTTQKPAQLAAKSRVSVDLAGVGLDTVTKAVLNGVSLLFAAYASGKSISLMVPGDAIPAPGKDEIRLETKSGKALSAPVFIN